MDATGGPLLKQGRELGIKAVFSFGDGACTDEMAKLAGEAAEGLLCSQAGIPVAGGGQEIPRRLQEEVQRRPDPLLAVHLRRGQHADRRRCRRRTRADPAKYLPELQKIDFKGATGKIAFDGKGDRKDAEMTIFTMKGGKLEPVAVIKGGKTQSFDEFVKGMK